MADVDPRIVEFEREAAKTLAAMKRSQARAVEFDKATEKGTASARDLETRVRQEVAKDRIKGETIGETRAPSKTAKAAEAEAQATSKTARETENLSRIQAQAQKSEANLNRTRAAGTRTLESDLAVMRRYGQFAGTRYLQAQPGGLSSLQQLRLEQAQAGRLPGTSERNPQKLLPAGTPPPQPERGALYPYPDQRPVAQSPIALGPGADAEAQQRIAAERVKAQSAVNESLREQQRVLAQGQQNLAAYTRENQRLIQVQASGSNVLRKHGALTSEFIQAAQRGEVTIRELGYQTSATIGKFGGWLVAGGAVYAALGAVTAMGRGAIDAYSGVNQLTRVINGIDASKARGEFRALSDEFNLPIADVTEAAYQMGKVFHDQDDALKTSRSVLYSVAVGELDVATATRYLTAITNGFKLEAKDMPGVFDQINQAQNKFGISIADVEAGVAKAAGTFKAAGGDFSSLLAIITTAQKATGVTGEVAGTAIARAPNFLRQASNQAALREFGINANAPIDQIIDQAFKKARNLQGDRIQELAAAIFGPQYGARIGTPLLQQFDLYQKVLDKTSPENSRGSAKRELDKQLASVENQIKNIGIQLQILGANLAESGLVDIFAGVVLSLDDALRLVNQMVEAFNSLPDGLKTTLSYMLQISLILRALQRFNIGGALAPPGQQVNPGRQFLGAALGGGDNRDARLIRKGLYDAQTHLQDQRARLATEATAASERAVNAQTRANAAQAQVVRLEKAGLGDSEAHARALQNASIFEAEAQDANRRRLVASLDQEETAKRLNETDASIARTRGRFGGLNVPATLDEARKGGFYPTSFGTPTTEPPKQYAAGLGTDLPAGRAAGSYPMTEQQFQQVQAAQTKAQEEAKRTTARTSRFRSAASRAGGFANSLIGSFGNIFAGIFFIGVTAELLTGMADSLGKEVDDLTANTATTAKDRTKKLNDLAAKMQEGSSFKDVVSDTITDPLHAPSLLNIAAGGKTLAEQQRDSINEQQRANITLQLEQQNAAAREGKPLPFRYAADIKKDIEKVKQSGRSRKSIDEALKQYDAELGLSLESLGQAGGDQKAQAARLKAAQQAINAARASNAGDKTLGARVKALQQDQVTAQLESELTLLGQPGGYSGQQARRAGILYRDMIRRLGGSKNPEDIQALDQARSSYYDALQSSIQDELDGAIALAKSPQERNAAYATAFDRLRQQFVTKGDNDVARQQKEIDDIRKKIADAQGGDRIAIPTRGGTLHTIAGPDTDRLKKLRLQLKAETDSLKQLTADQKQRRVLFEQMQDELRQQQYEENAALREARVAYRVSRTGDPLVQARLNIDHLGKEIERAITVYGKNSKEVLDLMSQRQQAIAEEAQAQLSNIEAQGALTAAGLSGKGNEVEKAQAELGNMKRRLAYMQANRRLFDPSEIVNLQAEIVSARIALAQQIEDEAEALDLAIIDIAIARADAQGNDVASARQSLRRSRYELRHADTPQERKEARAGLISAKAGVRQSIFDRETEDIQYQADIGKLTLQQQISAYKGLLNTLNLTRDMRRDLKKKIYDLQHSDEDGSFDLAVGNIKLPTIYEIKRALGGGVNQQSTVVVNNNPTVNVNGVADPAANAREVNKQIGGSNKAAMRSAGLV